MYCRKCGTQLDDQAVYCTQCGSPQHEETTQPLTNQEGKCWGWGILGFISPVVGLILFLVWKDTKPKASKSAGIGALINVIASILLIILTILLGILTTNSVFY